MTKEDFSDQFKELCARTRRPDDGEFRGEIESFRGTVWDIVANSVLSYQDGHDKPWSLDQEDKKFLAEIVGFLCSMLNLAESPEEEEAAADMTPAELREKRGLPPLPPYDHSTNTTLADIRLRLDEIKEKAINDTSSLECLAYLDRSLEQCEKAMGLMAHRISQPGQTCFRVDRGQEIIGYWTIKELQVLYSAGKLFPSDRCWPVDQPVAKGFDVGWLFSES
jgi:hypothetical protein